MKQNTIDLRDLGKKKSSGNHSNGRYLCLVKTGCRNGPNGGFSLAILQMVPLHREIMGTLVSLCKVISTLS